MEFSEDDLHRFYLKCTWNSNNSMVFVMLNPSISDSDVCDSTIETVIELAIEQGCGAIEIINLFSRKDPNSKILANGVDLVRQDNKKWINMVLENATNKKNKVVLAWGEKGYYYNANAYLLKLINDYKINPYCL